MDPITNLLDEITEYLHADAVLRESASPAASLAIAATLIRKSPRHETPAQAGFRLRLEDEILRTDAADAI